MTMQIESKKSLIESEAIIKSNEDLVGMGVWNIGNELRSIRDNQTYRQKNYISFEEYAEKELRYSRRHTYRFIEIAESYSVTSMSQITNIGMTKLLALAQIPEPEREGFMESQPIEDMTTRELQQAIREKKELERQLQEIKSRSPKVLVKEKVVEKIPDDYNDLKKKALRLEKQLLDKDHELESAKADKDFLERKAKLNDAEAKKYKDLKDQIEKLSQQKNDLGRQIKARTELSGLVVRIEHLLKTELAPVKYTRAIDEARDDEVVIRNLTDIVSRVSNWCREMENIIQPGRDYFYIESEVINE